MEYKRFEGLQVIGTGLPRTGSTSLKVALEMLGFGPCHHFKSDVGEEKFPFPNSRLWQEAGRTQDRHERQRILRTIYTEGGHRSGTDYPTSCFVEDLVEMYPNAKFVHCERSCAELWRKSVNETIGRMQRPSFYIPAMLVPVYALSTRRMLNLYNERALRLLGAPFFGPETDVGVYHAHNQHVRRVVPRERLLVFDPKSGFQPLCDFLGVPVPKDGRGRDLPFPHVNDRDAMMRAIQRSVVAGWTMIAMIICLFLAFIQMAKVADRIGH